MGGHGKLNRRLKHGYPKLSTLSAQKSEICTLLSIT
jgi:hypothetical protein